VQPAGHREQRVAVPKDHLRDGLPLPHGALLEQPVLTLWLESCPLWDQVYKCDQQCLGSIVVRHK